MTSAFDRIGLDAVLRPDSVAVVGASRTRNTPGAEILRNIVSGGFTGHLYAVNPKATEAIAGVATFPSVAGIGEPVDLAIVVVPAALVSTVARECAEHGVRALVVISAGFAEEGGEGVRRQDELLGVCTRSGMRLVGPNCIGVINTDPAVSLNATFVAMTPRPGSIALISQSGGLGVATMAMAEQRALGLSVFVSIGNRADVSANDVLEFVEHDEGTDVALLYVESFGNPRNFSRIARRVSASTPIVAVKGGRSKAGAMATASHTGSLVSASDATVDALFRQAGVLRADTLEELVDLGSLLGRSRAPGGPRLGVIGSAGGLGILAADAAESAGMVVPEFSESLRARLVAIKPEASTRNPVDLLAVASADVYRDSLSAIAESGEVDSMVVVCMGPMGDPSAGPDAEVTDLVLELAADPPHGITIAPVLVCGDLAVPHAPVFGAPERAARALGRAWRYQQWRNEGKGRLPRRNGAAHAQVDAVLDRVLRENRAGAWLSASDVAAVLGAYGVSVLETFTVATPEEVGRVASSIGAPVAVKAEGPTLLHKTDAGAVLLDVSPEAAEAAAAELLVRLTANGHEPTGLLVQEMIKGGVELIVGVVHDAVFGPLVACGAGGVLTELLSDVSIRLAPVADVEAAAMVSELRTYPLLTGYRGAKPCDLEAVHDVVLKVSRLAADEPRIAELDINPLVATPTRAIPLDVRIRVARPPRPPRG